MAQDVDRVRDWVRDQEQDLLAHLIGWVRLRPVAAEEEHAVDLERSANWLAGVLRETGFPTVELWRSGGPPAVFAEWRAEPGAPTVLVYSHHDVRAAKDDTWTECPPFEPALRDGRLYGRGASDAKGQVLCHVWALRAHLAATGRDRPAVNVQLLVEGEEEASSPHLAALLEQQRDRLDPDFVIVSDTMLWAAHAPAVCVGVRGMLEAHLEVMGPRTDIHAGAVSGVVPNPIVELSALLAQLRDERGRVTLPGFYDDVADASPEEREQLAQLPQDEDEWLERTGGRSVVGEAGYTLAERLYVRPSVDVTAFLAGDPTGASRGAVPSMAAADVKFLLVPDQTVERVAEQVRRWVDERISPHVAYELTLSEELGQQPYVTPRHHPALAVLRAAMEQGFEQPVGHMRNAGGAPAALLASTLGTPVLFFGTGLPEDRWHDSNESVLVDVLLKGVVSMAVFWEELAARGTG
ncbi:M20/M25/M40 family metallo-hydrolase [Motilibacter deserti]|uniref:M20 family dipeptidase n=1 Tax=Motilibacter deserti TaxID=2714956 RepID=A0ABX0GTS5_9ACTN|nr:M20/M25/M40 family metallo-hydrolase [Motilibacter deserti]NHC14308.1 M20 family dipeptidase [Motilibacter deserti]